MVAIVAAVAAIVGGLVTQAGVYLVARRSKSGRIDTTEAATLWTESSRIREELRQEVVLLRDELTRTRVESEHLRTDAERFRGEAEAFRAEASRLSAELARAGRLERRQQAKAKAKGKR